MLLWCRRGDIDVHQCVVFYGVLGDVRHRHAWREAGTIYRYCIEMSVEEEAFVRLIRISLRRICRCLYGSTCVVNAGGKYSKLTLENMNEIESSRTGTFLVLQLR